MTVAEVKNHFENAKEVMCLMDNNVVDISDIKIEIDVHKFCTGSYYIDFFDKSEELQSICLWTKKIGFAEIVSYKTFEIGKEYEAIKDFIHASCKVIKGDVFTANSESSLVRKNSYSNGISGGINLIENFKLVDKKEVIDNLKDTTPSYAKIKFKVDTVELINEFDITWSESKPKASHFVSDVDWQEKYNQLRKDNIKLSRDYDECKIHNGKMCDENIVLQNPMSNYLYKISHLKNEISAITKRESKLIVELESNKSEIEDYKKTIKSFESDSVDTNRKINVYMNYFIMSVLIFIAWSILKDLINL